MAPKRSKTPTNRTRDRQEKARRTVAAVLSDEQFMDGVREALDEEARGEKGTPFKDLKRKHARR